MNLVDVFVSEVIVPPHQKENGEWETVIKTVCYGVYKEEVIVGPKEGVEKYVVGYKWLE